MKSFKCPLLRNDAAWAIFLPQLPAFVHVCAHISQCYQFPLVHLLLQCLQVLGRVQVRQDIRSDWAGCKIGQAAAIRRVDLLQPPSNMHRYCPRYYATILCTLRYHTLILCTDIAFRRNCIIIIILVFTSAYFTI